MEQTSFKVEQNEFACIICMEITQDSSLTTCCDALVCNKCVEEFKKKQITKCPKCRKSNLQFKEIQVFMKRIIGNLPTICSSCKTYKTTISELKYHIKRCPGLTIECEDKKCKSKFLPKDYEEHVYNKHELGIVELFKIAFKQKEKILKIEEQERSSKNQVKELQQILQLSEEQERKSKVQIKQLEEKLNLYEQQNPKKILEQNPKKILEQNHKLENQLQVTISLNVLKKVSSYLNKLKDQGMSQYSNNHNDYFNSNNCDLYGLHQRITIGKCNTNEPQAFIEKLKWSYWNDCNNKSDKEVQQAYLEFAKKLNVIGFGLFE